MRKILIDEGIQLQDKLNSLQKTVNSQHQGRKDKREIDEEEYQIINKFNDEWKDHAKNISSEDRNRTHILDEFAKHHASRQIDKYDLNKLLHLISQKDFKDPNKRFNYEIKTKLWDICEKVDKKVDKKAGVYEEKVEILQYVKNVIEIVEIKSIPCYNTFLLREFSQEEANYLLEAFNIVESLEHSKFETILYWWSFLFLGPAFLVFFGCILSACLPQSVWSTIQDLAKSLVKKIHRKIK